MRFIFSPDPDKVLESIRGRLKNTLGLNLHSLGVYGSYVRGNFRKGLSDINLLIVLNESTAAAHQAISNAIGSEALIEPFIVERRGLERTMQVFGLKFASIKRNFKLLEGEDPFTGLNVPPALSRFLCEQSLRNLELRTTHAFVVGRGNRKMFSRRLSQLGTALFVDLSEMARLSGQSVPNDLPARVPVIEKVLGRPLPILTQMLELKAHPRTLSPEQINATYGELLAAMTAALRYMETEWKVFVFEGARA